MRIFVLLLLSVLISACSILSLDGSENVSEIRIENETREDIWVGLLEETVLHVIDPSPYFYIDDAPFPIIEQGKSRAFKLEEIDGFERGNNLGMLIYTLTGNPRGGPGPSADLVRIHVVTHRELVAGAWKISLDTNTLFPSDTVED